MWCRLFSPNRCLNRVLFRSCVSRVTYHQGRVVLLGPHQLLRCVLLQSLDETGMVVKDRDQQIDHVARPHLCIFRPGIHRAWRPGRIGPVPRLCLCLFFFVVMPRTVTRRGRCRPNLVEFCTQQLERVVVSKECRDDCMDGIRPRAQVALHRREYLRQDHAGRVHQLHRIHNVHIVHENRMRIYAGVQQPCFESG